MNTSTSLAPARPMLVGLTGRKQSGKSTAAEALAGVGYVLDAFADDLKRIVYATRGIRVRVPAGVDPLVPEEYFSSYQDVLDRFGADRAKEAVPDVRSILQTFGTEGVRAVLGENVWIDQVMRRVSEREQAGVPTVVPDVRFPNEAQAILDAGGLLLRIVRPGQPTADAHDSERHIAHLPAHADIVNDSGLETLRARVLAAVLGR